MTDEVLQERPLEDDSVSLLFEGDLSGVVAKFMVGLGVVGTFRSVWEVWIWQVDGFWDGVVEVLMPLFYLSIAIIAIYSLVRGERPEGLLIDDEGIVDRTKRLFPAGRVYWNEIKGIKPLNQSFLGVPLFRSTFILDVTDGVILRQRARTRLSLWWIKHMARVQGIPLSSMFLPGTREQVLKVLRDRLDQHELRSIAEAKGLEAGM